MARYWDGVNKCKKPSERILHVLIVMSIHSFIKMLLWLAHEKEVKKKKVTPEDKILLAFIPFIQQLFTECV